MNSHLKATGLVEHFAHPEWQATVNGELALKQIGYLRDWMALRMALLDSMCRAATAR